LKYSKVLSRYNGRGDADFELYGGNIDTPTNCIVDTDTDGDGIIDNSDQCPTQAGPSSNNGCPIPVGDPDLTIDTNNTFIFSDCFDCSSQLSSLGSKRHKINNQSGILNINSVMVKNLGNGSSSNSNIQYYVSSNSTLSTNDFKSTSPATSLGSINSGQNLIKSKSLFISDFGSSGRFTGNWYILMVVDDSKSNDKSDETINVTAIPVTFTDPFSSLKINTSSLILDNDNEELYQIEIYNFSGQKVFSKKVNSIEEENELLNNLFEGMYIIKSKNSDRKASIN